MKLLTGYTYPHKDVIKSKGGKWSSDKKAWEVPADVYDELMKLIGQRPKMRRLSRKFECEQCGDIVWSGTNCWETGLEH